MEWDTVTFMCAKEIACSAIEHLSIQIKCTRNTKSRFDGKFPEWSIVAVNKISLSVFLLLLLLWLSFENVSFYTPTTTNKLFEIMEIFVRIDFITRLNCSRRFFCYNEMYMPLCHISEWMKPVSGQHFLTFYHLCFFAFPSSVPIHCLYLFLVYNI